MAQHTSAHWADVKLLLYSLSPLLKRCGVAIPPFLLVCFENPPCHSTRIAAKGTISLYFPPCLSRMNFFSVKSRSNFFPSTLPTKPKKSFPSFFASKRFWKFRRFVCATTFVRPAPSSHLISTRHPTCAQIVMNTDLLFHVFDAGAPFVSVFIAPRGRHIPLCFPIFFCILHRTRHISVPISEIGSCLTRPIAIFRGRALWKAIGSGVHLVLPATDLRAGRFSLPTVLVRRPPSPWSCTVQARAALRAQSLRKSFLYSLLPKNNPGNSSVVPPPTNSFILFLSLRIFPFFSQLGDWRERLHIDGISFPTRGNPFFSLYFFLPHEDSFLPAAFWIVEKPALS